MKVHKQNKKSQANCISAIYLALRLPSGSKRIMLICWDSVSALINIHHKCTMTFRAEHRKSFGFCVRSNFRPGLAAAYWAKDKFFFHDYLLLLLFSVTLYSIFKNNLYHFLRIKEIFIASLACLFSCVYRSTTSLPLWHYKSYIKILRNFQPSAYHHQKHLRK